MKNSIKSLIFLFALSTWCAFDASADDKESKKVTAFGTGIYLNATGKVLVNVDKFNNKPTIVQVENERGEIFYREVSGKRVKKLRKSLDISTLPNGNYTINVISDGQKQSRSIELKEKPTQRLISFK